MQSRSRKSKIHPHDQSCDHLKIQNFVPHLNSWKTNFLRPLAYPGVFSIKSCAGFNAQKQNPSVGSRAIKIFIIFRPPTCAFMKLKIFWSTITLSTLVPQTSRLAYLNPHYVPVIGEAFVCWTNPVRYQFFIAEGCKTYICVQLNCWCQRSLAQRQLLYEVPSLRVILFYVLYGAYRFCISKAILNFWRSF